MLLRNNRNNFISCTRLISMSARTFHRFFSAYGLRKCSKTVQTTFYLLRPAYLQCNVYISVERKLILKLKYYSIVLVVSNT